jgi:hypothetical protein
MSSCLRFSHGVVVGGRRTEPGGACPRSAARVHLRTRRGRPLARQRPRPGAVASPCPTPVDGVLTPRPVSLLSGCMPACHPRAEMSTCTSEPPGAAPPSSRTRSGRTATHRGHRGTAGTGAQGAQGHRGHSGHRGHRGHRGAQGAQMRALSHELAEARNAPLHLTAARQKYCWWSYIDSIRIRRHRHVEDREVDVAVAAVRDRLRAVLRLGHHVQAWLAVEDDAHSPTYECVVVGQQDACAALHGGGPRPRRRTRQDRRGRLTRNGC